MKIALAGNPNCGKTTLFNTLTGSTAHVGNWPGVTVDKREGVYKKSSELVEIVDLPGIYSLSPYTPEEVVSRNFIVDEKPDLVINIVDATNLERNLYLTTQLLEIDVPVVIALNMMDVLYKNGDSIDLKVLEDKLGVRVVEISALKKKGISDLMDVAIEEAKKPRTGFSVLSESNLSDLVDRAKGLFEKENIDSPLFHAIKLIEGDEIEVNNHVKLDSELHEFKEKHAKNEFDGDFEGVVADLRYKYITKNISKAIKRNSNNNEELTKSDKVDKVLTHRVFAIPIFLVIMFIVFHFVFSEDLLGLNRIFKVTESNPTVVNVFTAMGYDDLALESIDEAVAVLDLSDEELLELNATLLDPNKSEEEKAEAQEQLDLYNLMSGFNNQYELESETNEELGEFNEYLLEKYKEGNTELNDAIEVELEGIPSPGVFLQSWMGFATGSLIDLFRSFMPEETWYTGLVCDGILTGLDSIFSFLPQILLLFLFLSLLEDSGYIARVAFIMDRAFRRFGLSGKSFIPLLMGFGCSVPAMMATKTLEDEKERDMTIRISPFFSCGAKAPIWALLALCVAGSFLGDIFVFSIYVLGIVIAIVSALLIKAFSKNKEIPPFIMELPQYHLPQAKSLLVHLWEKFKHFIYKASTIITAAIVLIWFLSNFSWAFWNGLVDSIDDSILASIGHVLKYLFYPCGWAIGAEGWKYTVASITGLIAKEDVVATMSQLGLAEGTINLSNAQIYAFAAFNLITFPCFAAIATAKSESSKKGFVFTLLWWILASYVVSIVVYLIGLLFEVFWLLGILGILVALGAVVLTWILDQKLSNKPKLQEA